MIIVVAMLLDAVFGEPKWIWERAPHPAILMGRLIGDLEKHYNAGPNRKRNGIAVMAGLVTGAIVLGRLLEWLPGQLIDVLLGAFLLAQKSLVEHLRAVAHGMNHSLQAGRQAVAMIVSRDTAAMDESAIARSAIESGAENLSDGVIAPVFWFVLFGLPGLLVYKITNTADSMIGYRTARYQAFGWAAARLDDVLNWVPARLTALMIWVIKRGTAFAEISADAKHHRSPNAGWPEAAMARHHNIALAGPRSYDGVTTQFPYVHESGRKDLHASDITACIGTLWQVWGMTLVAVLALSILGLA